MSRDPEPKSAEEAVTSRASSPSSDSESDDPTSLSTSRRDTPTEWLATTRDKRATAGNRMKSMLANEEPDSDMELLFAEDDDDQGFSDEGDDGSDVHMDSSSDEEDNAAGADDDMEGEKELERQAKEKRAAQRKRKAQDAIPAKFRKKVRIDPTSSRTVTPAPAPRPKKKSERASWLPTEADAPTRASSRSTTKLSKEQLHNQMKEREVRRLEQVRRMEKQAARREAAKKPAMTQEERLREAEIVERRNSKSLNRWEVAEKQREDERKAKLAALNERTLKGPVITFWSGTREWKDGGLAKFAVLEEKPKRKERKKKDDKPKESEKKVQEDGKRIDGATQEQAQATNPEVPKDDAAVAPPEDKAAGKDQDGDISMKMEPVQAAHETATPGPKPPESAPVMAMPPGPPPSGLAAPAPAPPATPSTSSDAKPSSVLAAPSLAPPEDIKPTQTPPKPEPPKPSNLAIPNTEQSEATPTTPQASEPFIQARLHLIEPDTPIDKPSGTPSEAPEPEPKATTATRQAIVYQNFDNNAIKDKSIQTQILFGRKMNKLAKPAPQPLCVITHQPARYRDPGTGLPFYNRYAYEEIQRLKRGDYRFSKLLGAWAGSGVWAAAGVPDRFLNPDAPGPERKKEEEKPDSHGDVKVGEAEGDKSAEGGKVEACKVEEGKAEVAKEGAEGDGGRGTDERGSQDMSPLS